MAGTGCATRRRSSCRPSSRAVGPHAAAPGGHGRDRRAPGGLLDDFDARLPFVLTEGQREVGDEICAELAAPRPMQRLLQGEVGSGKTVVALRAMLQVVDAGGQAALLAPTEVLAAQHLRTLRALLGPLARGRACSGERTTGPGSRCSPGRRAPRRGDRTCSTPRAGGAGIVVGTHALLSETVQFADLGLVVVDEQHRFGVEQRDLLPREGHDDAAPARHDRDAHPADGGDDRLRRPGDVDPDARSRPVAAAIVTHVVPADNGRLDRADLAAGARGGRRRPPGLRRVPADRRRRPGRARRRRGGGATVSTSMRGGAGRGPLPPLRAVTEVVESSRALPALAGVRDRRPARSHDAPRTRTG